MPRYNIRKFHYDAAGNLEGQETAVSENEWRRTDYIYDARGRQTSSFAYLDSACNEWQQVCMIYDAVGNKLEVSNGRASYGEPAIWRTVRYAYDRFGNVTAYTDGLEQTEYRNYDVTGLLVNKVLRDGAKVKYLYDPLGRIIDETAVMPNADSETPVRKTTSYTRTGQKREVVSYEVRTNQAFSRSRFLHTSFAPLAIRCKYDASGRLIEQQDPDKAVKLYEYDAAGNRAVFRLKRNGDTELDLRYTYDNQNRLLTVSAADGSQFAAYTYDANGRRESQQFANGAETIYTYNKGSLLTELVNRNGEDILSSFSYTYALDGNQLSKTDANGDITEYAYDRLGRLVDETAPDYAISYAYDDWSNRLSLNYQSPNASECYAVDYEYDENNRLLVETKTIDNEVETSTYYYDANGNLVEKINNAEGVLVSERRSYNGFGYLVCFQKGEKEVWYRYRPDGLRHSKQIIEDSENRVTTHFWDGQNIVLESSTNGSTKAKYIRGLTLIAQGIDSSMFYYLHNGHGDVVQRIDSYGNPLVSYEYDAFGNQLNQSETDPNPFRYCGEYFDEETGEIYLRARYYNSRFGRFTREDPICSGRNWYLYCVNNPITYADSSGLEKVVVAGGYDHLEDSYPYEFIDSALFEISNYSGNEDVTLLLFNGGYTEHDLEVIRSYQEVYGFNCQLFNSDIEFINYINTGSVDGSVNTRAKDKITEFSLYAHGWPGQIMFGHGLGYTGDQLASVTLTANEVRFHIDSNAFNKAASTFYSCRTGTGGKNSFAQIWSNKTGGKTNALRGWLGIYGIGRSTYEHINAKLIEDFLTGGKEAYKEARQEAVGDGWLYSEPYPSYRPPSGAGGSVWDTYKPQEVGASDPYIGRGGGGGRNSHYIN